MISTDSLENLKRFLAKDPKKLNEIFYLGESLLGLATFIGSYEQVEYLLQQGADVNQYDPNQGGITAIRYAFQNNNKDKFTLLLSHNARMDLPDWYEKTLQDDLLEIGVTNVKDIPEEYWNDHPPTMEEDENIEDFRKRFDQYFIDRYGELEE